MYQAEYGLLDLLADLLDEVGNSASEGGLSEQAHGLYSRTWRIWCRVMVQVYVVNEVQLL